MSGKYSIAVVPGDGTGPEVVAEGIKALVAVSRRCSTASGENDASEVLLNAIRAILKNDLKSLDAGGMGYGTKGVGDLVVKYVGC